MLTQTEWGLTELYSMRAFLIASLAGLAAIAADVCENLPSSGVSLMQLHLKMNHVGLSEAKAVPPFWPRYGGRRQVMLLDGTWQFGLHSVCPATSPCRLTDRGPATEPLFDSLDPNFNCSDPAWTPNITTVPSSFDVTPPGHLAPRGVAMYRTFFDQTGPARIQFMGCAFYCRVFLDGQEVGEHRAGGFSSWWLDLPSSEAKTRELFVLADNRFNSTTAPMHSGGDFYMHGGLIRSVLLHQLADTPWVWRAHVFPCKSGNKASSDVDIKVLLTDQNFSGEVSYSLAFDGGPATPAVGQAVSGQLVVEGVPVPNPRMWSLEDPQLHTVTVVIDGASVTERFGLRAWGVGPHGSHRHITLNDQVIKLRGYNHHLMWPDVGASPPDAYLDKDLALLQEVGANFVRGAHYPQDQRWLDRLDEAGLGAWEEALGPNVSAEATLDPYFMKYQLQQMAEMLEVSMNHPSIMAWAFFNEGPSDNGTACPAYAANADFARARDPTRLVTWASCKDFSQQKCIAHADVVSWNSYPGWYDDPGKPWAPALDWINVAQISRELYPDKPFLISETGAEGFYQSTGTPSQELFGTGYQSDVVRADVSTALSSDLFSGIVIWVLTDYKANDADQILNEPCEYIPHVQPPTCSTLNLTVCAVSNYENKDRIIDFNGINLFCRIGGENRKGSLDIWRRKKPVFQVVSKQFHSSPAQTPFQVLSQLLLPWLRMLGLV